MQIETAAEWVADLTLDDIPPDVVELAVHQRINLLASLWAGARTEAGAAAVAALDRIAEPGDVVTLPDGKPRSLLAAAWHMAVLPNALELDDFVFAGHTGQAAVAVPLTLGQVVGASGEDALVAQIAANEVAGRLGAVMTAGPQHGHMKAYLHRSAATVAACRLLRLDAPQIARALAISLSAPEYPLFPAAFSADTKVLCTGDPVVAGIRAAFLAADGVDAAHDIVEHAVGLVTSLSNHDQAPDVWGRLGETWSTSAICYKPWPACAYAAAATTAMVRLASAVDGLAERIRAIEVGTTILSLTMEGFSAPHRPGHITAVNTNFSTRRTLALTALVGAPTGRHFEPAAFRALAPRIAELAERVRLYHHWPHTIGMLRGVDRAIDHPGRPGIYGMGEAHRTMARFNQAFGTPKALGLDDIPRLLSIDPADTAYLLRRYAVGLRARLPFLGGKAARKRYRSQETDLRRMELRFSAQVRVFLDHGRELVEEVIVPPGFAGDPNRLQVPLAKFAREVGNPEWLAVLRQRPFPSPLEIVNAGLTRS